MDNEWMKLKEFLKSEIEEEDKSICSLVSIIRLEEIKKVLEKMEELENGK